MCGIFAYINFLSPRERREILTFLINGLKRLEYRGYDSAGMAVDGDEREEDGSLQTLLVKQSGKVAMLEKAAHAQVSAAEHNPTREGYNKKMYFPIIFSTFYPPPPLLSLSLTLTPSLCFSFSKEL